MKPTLLQRVAPSPSVLSFLRAQVRNAFESPVAQRAHMKGQRRGYATSNQVYWSPKYGSRGGNSHSSGTRGVLGVASSTSRKCLLGQRAPRLAFDKSNVLRHISQIEQYFSSHRAFSTTRSVSAWNIFNSARQRRLAQLQAPPPPPDENSQASTGFGSSLGRIMRPANELKMRCTELDEHGNVTLVSGEFKKSELIAKVDFVPACMEYPIIDVDRAIVRSPPPRPPQNRFFSSPAHPR